MNDKQKFVKFVTNDMQDGNSFKQIMHLYKMFEDDLKLCDTCGWIDEIDETWYKCKGCKINICKQCFEDSGCNKKNVVCQRCEGGLE